MPSLVPAPAYIAGTLTLATGATPQQILAMILAAASASTNNWVNANGLSNDVLLFADEANTDEILIGDSSLSATNYGFSMPALASRRYGPFTQACFPFMNLWVMTKAAGVGQKLHFEITSC